MPSFLILKPSHNTNFSPFLCSAILDLTAGRDTQDDIFIHLPWSPNDSAIILNNVTMPGFLMAFLWGSLLIGLLFMFDEPLRINNSCDEGETEKTKKKGQNGPSKAGHVNSCVALVRVIFSNSAFLVSVSPFLKKYAFFHVFNARFHVFRCDRSLCIYLGSLSCREKC